jgi:zinc protease
LSNGARVFFKKTDFNESQILMSAQSFGGKGWFNDKDVVNFELMDQVINATGLGNFTTTELQKKLAGKQVSCSVSTGNATENLSGSSTPKDLRTLFELIYLRFQAPANDVDTYNTIIAGLRTQLENVEKLPQAAFSDSLTKTVYGNHPRANRIKLADIDKADYETIKRLYSERYNAGGDFDFYFTGNIDVDSLRLFAEQYIAPLKAVKKREGYNKKFEMEPLKGVRDNHFVRKMETPQATFIQLWTGDLKYTVKNAAVVKALGSILTERYLKSIREDGGMAYSVGASANASFGTKESYMVQIYCPVKPALKDEALRLVRLDIDKIAAEGVTAEELDKVKKFELKSFNDKQRENGYWQGLITSKVNWNKDTQKDYEKAIQSLSSKDVQNFVKNVLLKQNNCITVSMLPEDMTE